MGPLLEGRPLDDDQGDVHLLLGAAHREIDVRRADGRAGSFAVVLARRTHGIVLIHGQAPDWTTTIGGPDDGPADPFDRMLVAHLRGMQDGLHAVGVVAPEPSRNASYLLHAEQCDDVEASHWVLEPGLRRWRGAAPLRVFVPADGDGWGCED